MDAGSWSWLQSEVEDAVEGYLAALEGLDGASKVPNLDWTVAELTAHLASLPRLYRNQDVVGRDFKPPDDFAAFSVEQRAHIDTADLPAVAEHLRSEILGLLAQIDGMDPDGARWLYGHPTTHRNVAAGMLIELIVHGQDLAPLSGHRPELTREYALAGLPGAFAIMPVFIDPAKAAKAAGVYRLKMRGGDDWTYRIGSDGSFAVERGRPESADAHLSADPVAFLLVGLGRMNSNLAALTGKMIVWGRRPWKFLATADITIDGI